MSHGLTCYIFKYHLTHLSLDKMVAIYQEAYLDTLYGMKVYELRLDFTEFLS